MRAAFSVEMIRTVAGEEIENFFLDRRAKIAHLALSRIDIDLDDGVKVNYEKVQTGQDGKKIEILTAIK